MSNDDWGNRRDSWDRDRQDRDKRQDRQDRQRFDGTDHDRLIRLEERFSAQDDRIGALEREIETKSKTIADLQKIVTGWRAGLTILTALGAAVGYVLQQAFNFFHTK